jgi:hypothetical protein
LCRHFGDGDPGQGLSALIISEACALQGDGIKKRHAIAQIFNVMIREGLQFLL